MSLPSGLLLGAAIVIGLLGAVHLLYTFRGPKLLPRNPAVVHAMQGSALVLTKETSVWRAWLGFNASHGLGAVLFGFVFGHLALQAPALLFGSPFLQALALLVLTAWLALAWRYWFRIPFAGIALAWLLTLAAVLAAALD
jgi:hypothetical protein